MKTKNKDVRIFVTVRYGFDTYEAYRVWLKKCRKVKQIEKIIEE